MPSTPDYCLLLPIAIDQIFAHKVFDLVWRFDLSKPGFCAIDVASNMDSHALRRLMVTLKSHLSGISQKRTGVPFCFRSMGRFDQQETTKFHLDGAPERSMLILGYEPSAVASRLF